MIIYFYKSLMTWSPRFLHTFFNLWHHGGCHRPFLLLWYEGCMIQESYCCAVGIGQQAKVQCNRLAFIIPTQGCRNQKGTYPLVLANHSLEEKAEGLWFLVRYIYICLFFFQGVQCKDCKYNAHKKCSEKVPRDCTGEIALVSNFDAFHIVSFYETYKFLIFEKFQDGWIKSRT